MTIGENASIFRLSLVVEGNYRTPELQISVMLDLWTLSTAKEPAKWSSPIIIETTKKRRLNVSKGTRIRISGKRRNSRRGPLLVTDDGDIWVLECADEISLPAKAEVTVEGVVAGFDRLNVDWIGEVTSTS